MNQSDKNRNWIIPAVIIFGCAVFSVIAGLFLGKWIVKNKQIKQAQAYLEWESENHTWTDATCQSPRTCSVCGITDGEPAEHVWVDATCTDPRTCSLCGAVEGDPEGHEWNYATIDAPRTCKKCGATSGDPIRLVSFDFLPEDMAPRWDGKNYMNQWLIAQDGFFEMYTRVTAAKLSCFAKMHYYDSKVENDKCIAQIDLNSSEYYDFGVASVGRREVLILIKENVSYCFTFDQDLNQIGSRKVIEKGYKNKEVSEIGISKNRRYILIKKGNTVLTAYDTEKDVWLDEGYDDSLGEANPPKFDISDYSYICYEKAIDGYFFEKKELNQWGYVDKDGNTIAVYKDATAFTENGYALVSNDRKKYDLIDQNFNIVGKDVLEADTAGYVISNILAVARNQVAKYYEVIAPQIVDESKEMRQTASDDLSKLLALQMDECQADVLRFRNQDASHRICYLTDSYDHNKIIAIESDSPSIPVCGYLPGGEYEKLHEKVIEDGWSVVEDMIWYRKKEDGDYVILESGIYEKNNRELVITIDYPTTDDTQEAMVKEIACVDKITGYAWEEAAFGETYELPVFMLLNQGK